MPTLSVQNIVKTYRGRRVVNAVSLEVKNGSVVGLLGPNGAGKTTTFYMMVGMVKPDSGYIFWMMKTLRMIRCICVHERASGTCLRKLLFLKN